MFRVTGDGRPRILLCPSRGSADASGGTAAIRRTPTRDARASLRACTFECAPVAGRTPTCAVAARSLPPCFPPSHCLMQERTRARTHSRGLLLHGLLLPPQRLRVGGPHLLTVPPYFSQAPPALKRCHLPLLFPLSFAPASSSTPSSLSLPFLTSIIVSRDLLLISTLHQSSPLVAPSFSTLYSSIFNGTLQYLALRSVRPSRNAHPGGRKHFPASLADALRNRSEPL